MSNKEPLVSVIIPTFNRKKFLEDAVQSIVSQTYKNWECIIVDDGSDDLYGKQLVEEFKDKRIKFFSRPIEIEKGPSSCRNFGFNKSSGQYVKWLDDDDFLDQDSIALQVSALEQSDFEIALCSWDYYWDKKNLEVQEINNSYSFFSVKQIYDYLASKQTFFPPNIFLLSRNLIEKAGLWNEDLTLNDDAEFFNRQFIQAGKILNVAQALVYYRNHNAARVSEFNVNKIHSLIKSYALMHDQLQSKDIIAYTYFRWKLLKLLRAYGANALIRQFIFKEKSLFKDFGLNPNNVRYYKAKHWLYKRIYGQVKKRYLSKN